MNLKRFTMRRSIVACVAILIALTIVVSAVVVIPRSVNAQVPTEISENLDGWMYSARVGDAFVEVIVRYDISAQGIQKFSSANRKLVDQLSGASTATVVFARPLAVSEFTDLMQKSGGVVKSYTLRAIDQAGMRVTIQGAPKNSVLVPQGTLDGMISRLNRQSSGATLKGIVSVDVAATPIQLKQLLSDPRVFTADVTSVIAVERTRGKLAATTSAVAGLPIRIRQVTPLYWFMENAGIAPK